MSKAGLIVGTVIGSALGVAAAPVVAPVLAVCAAVGGFTGWLIGKIFGRPSRDNDTMGAVQSHHDVQELEKKKAALNEEKKRLDKEKERLDNEKRKREKERLEEQERLNKEKVSQDQESERLKNEKERLERERLDNERKEKLYQEAQRRNEQERKNLDEEKQKAEEMLRKAKKAQEEAKQGIQPTVMPSLEDLERARENAQYSKTNFHFAVAGVAGSGKSSLINAFRGLKDNDPKAAPTGVVETTMEITRYPDPHDQPPRKWSVWFDVPGAGTLDTPDWQYFNQQGLFIFDLIIVAVNDRFTQVDVAIIKNCRLFNIPCFIVRSKADSHIDNLMKKECGGDDLEDLSREEINNLRQGCRKEFVTQTQISIANGLDKAKLPQQRVYIVSCHKLRRAYDAFIGDQPEPKGMIDEMELTMDLLSAAHARRCDIPKPAQGQSKSAETAIAIIPSGDGGSEPKVISSCLEKEEPENQSPPEGNIDS